VAGQAALDVEHADLAAVAAKAGERVARGGPLEHDRDRLRAEHVPAREWRALLGRLRAFEHDRQHVDLVLGEADDVAAQTPAQDRIGALYEHRFAVEEVVGDAERAADVGVGVAGTAQDRHAPSLAAADGGLEQRHGVRFGEEGDLEDACGAERVERMEQDRLGGDGTSAFGPDPALDHGLSCTVGVAVRMARAISMQNNGPAALRLPRLL
jgi:hypothetical protein